MGYNMAAKIVVLNRVLICGPILTTLGIQYIFLCLNKIKACQNDQLGDPK